MKLWTKNKNKYSSLVEKFTTESDKIFDLKLAKYDCIGSIAHAAMLAKVGIISKKEGSSLTKELKLILKEIEKGNFKIEQQVEDIHSQIELQLTRKLGNTGKKIHSGRSRNDQVATDLKLFYKEEIFKIKNEVTKLFQQLIKLSSKNKNKFLPGYTHMQLAMPSSFGLWFGAYAEALVDDLEILKAALIVVNKNPLGSGAGFGTSLPIDRNFTTQKLNFAETNIFSTYAQFSRQKSEMVLGCALSSIANTISKMAMDITLYLNPHFNILALPEEFTTGSSIMPHKKNPDLFELLRANCNQIQSIPHQLSLITSNLTSGYHRDFQTTKEVLFPAIEKLKNCVQVLTQILPHLIISKIDKTSSFYLPIFSVEEVNRLVVEGVPFREAYKIIGKNISSFKKKSNVSYSHIGSIGNPSPKRVESQMKKVLSNFPKK